MITVGKIKEEFYTLAALGYPVGDDTDIILDYDMRSRNVVLGFAFEDHGFKITIHKEIREDDDNKG